jgi:hypothetical protein
VEAFQWYGIFLRHSEKSMPRARSSPTTSAVHELTKDGFRFVLTPVGITRAGHGFFWVGLCFCLGITVITASFLLLATGNSDGGVDSFDQLQSLPLLAWVVLGAFWVVSIWAALFGASMGIRSGVIEVAGNSLRVREKKLLSRRQHQWTNNELIAIQTGPSGFSVGRSKKTGRSGAAGKSIQQLHIHLSDGRRLRLFTGRDADELDWISSELRQALNLTHKAYDGG